MKFKNFLNTVAMLACVYELGRISGSIRCFNKLTTIYKDALFEKEDVVVYKVNRTCTICKVKPKEEGDK